MQNQSDAGNADFEIQLNQGHIFFNIAVLNKVGNFELRSSLKMLVFGVNFGILSVFCFVCLFFVCVCVVCFFFFFFFPFYHNNALWENSHASQEYTTLSIFLFCFCLITKQNKNKNKHLQLLICD